MKKRVIGVLTVSEIGMGCMGFSHGYGTIPSEQYSIEAIEIGFANGCNFFDTAEVYGPNLDPQYFGHNERLVGMALRNIGGISRSDYVIGTKLHLGEDETAEKGIYQAVKDHLTASLERLGTEYVDLYYLHRVTPVIPVEEVAGAMGKLHDEGLIITWGLSAVPVDIIERAHRVFPLSAVQNIYSMVERGVEDKVIPYCLEHNIGLVPFSPIASGLLSGKVTADTKFEKVDDVRNFVPQLQKENITANQPIVELIRKYAQMKGATPAQISLAWMLKKYPNVVPIPGSKNKERIIENLGATDVCLTDEEFMNLDYALNQIEVHGVRGYNESDGHGVIHRDGKHN